MKDHVEVQRLAQEAEQELRENILPFWMNLQDETYGGYYGVVDDQLRIEQQAHKGVIVTTRILWTFSAAYRVTGNSLYLDHATHAYQFLTQHMFDEQYGGLYWMLDYTGKVIDDRKHVYAHSFGIYALSEYYRASDDTTALQYAVQLFELVEEKGFNTYNQAYMEEFDRTWRQMPNEMLSEQGLDAAITTNTHLHILEAYTNLYRVWPDERLKRKLEHVLALFYKRIYVPEKRDLQVFFDEQWQSLIDYESYGHDIEASWLIDDTLRVLTFYDEAYDQMVIDIAYNIADKALAKDGAVVNEKVNGQLDETRIWWVQAEAIVGFVNAYSRTGDVRFIDIACGVWRYIKDYIVDDREGGEWYSSVEPDGRPTAGRHIADPWKANYHNGRFCLEMIERIR